MSVHFINEVNEMKTSNVMNFAYDTNFTALND